VYVKEKANEEEKNDDDDDEENIYKTLVSFFFFRPLCHSFFCSFGLLPTQQIIKTDL